MSFRRVGWVAAIAVATLLELSCGQVYRPVVIPIGTTPPNPANFHEVFALSANAPYNPGTALQIDVSGDTNIGEADMGVNPTHAAILPNHSRVFVASAGSLYTGESDLVTSFSPASDSSIATGLGLPTVYTLPNVGATQTAAIVNISEAGSLVTVTLSSPLINALVGNPIVISGVVIPCQNPPACTIPLNPTGYDGSFPISFVSGTTVQYVNSITGLTPTSGGTATIPLPLFCRYLPDFVSAEESNTVFVANFGEENGTHCNLASTDSIAALGVAQGTISQIMYLAPGAHPIAMAETPDSQNLYVLNEGKDSLGNNDVLNLSPTDLSTVATIAVGNTPGSIPIWAVARPDNQRVYVLTQGDLASSESGQLIPIDPATNSILPTQTNLSVGPGANFVLYDPHLNRLYVTNPNTSTVYVFSATGGVDLSGNANDTPTLMATIDLTAGVNAPCPTGCSPVSVAALQDGSRFYVASYQSQAACTDANVGLASSCIVPMLTVFDAASITVKPATSTLLPSNPSLSLLTSPQFAATQYALAPVAACVPATVYSPGSTRFRMFATAAADNSHVYVSICDAGSIADINTTTNSVASSSNNAPDQLITNIAPQFSACTGLTCDKVANISAFSITSNVITFQAANHFVAGQQVTISSLTSSAGAPLNGQSLTVLATGLSSSQFECNLPVPQPDVALTIDSGAAAGLPVATITGFSITSNVITVQAANQFAAGQKVTLAGLGTSAGTSLNGVDLTVLPTALSSSQFVANLPTTQADVPLTSDSGIVTPLPVASIASFSISSNVITFQAANEFVAGEKLSITGMTSTAGTALNGLTLTVLNASPSTFQANFTCVVATNPCTTADVGSTSDTGSAVPLPAPQPPIFLLTGQ